MRRWVNFCWSSSEEWLPCLLINISPGLKFVHPFYFNRHHLHACNLLFHLFSVFDATECLFSGFLHITRAHATEHTSMKLDQGSSRHMEFYFLKLECIALFCNQVEIISLHVTSALLAIVLFECRKSFLSTSYETSVCTNTRHSEHKWALNWKLVNP